MQFKKLRSVTVNRTDGRRRHEVRYRLIHIVLSTGDGHFFVTGHLLAWEGYRSLNESFQISPSLGRSRLFASKIFRLVSNAKDPVFPNHMHDVVQDLLLDQQVQSEKGQPDSVQVNVVPMVSDESSRGQA